jgi:hypothetical protein
MSNISPLNPLKCALILQRIFPPSVLLAENAKSLESLAIACFYRRSRGFFFYRYSRIIAFCGRLWYMLAFFCPSKVRQSSL